MRIRWGPPLTPGDTLGGIRHRRPMCLRATLLEAFDRERDFTQRVSLLRRKKRLIPRQYQKDALLVSLQLPVLGLPKEPGLRGARGKHAERL